MVRGDGSQCAGPLIFDKDLVMNSNLSLAVIAFILAFTGPTLAFDASDLAKVQAGKDCEKCDLFVADLSGADLSDANLSDANLSDANLSVADLSDAGLSDADLFGADLPGANLSKTLMNGAILCNTTMPDGSVIYSGC
jgi:uncharacterized protein YjbI with pentapeptide repeats